MTSLNVRRVDPGDVPGLKTVLEATELFPPQMLEGMLAAYLAGDPDHQWMVAHRNATPLGFCFAEAEALTEGTWNMRALGVHPDHQRAGAGRALVAALEGALHAKGQRLLIVDTASGPDLAPARAFYAAIGYAAEARIRDFWAAGEDKVTFRKVL